MILNTATATLTFFFLLTYVNYIEGKSHLNVLKTEKNFVITEPKIFIVISRLHFWADVLVSLI